MFACLLLAMLMLLLERRVNDVLDVTNLTRLDEARQTNGSGALRIHN